MIDRDYWVTVCAACRCASCWHAEFFCASARTASTTEAKASLLRDEDREHPSNYSVDKIREVCGSVRYVA